VLAVLTVDADRRVSFSFEVHGKVQGLLMMLGEVALDNTAGLAFEYVLDFDTQQALASACRLKAFPYRQMRLV